MSDHTAQTSDRTPTREQVREAIWDAWIEPGSGGRLHVTLDAAVDAVMDLLSTRPEPAVERDAETET